MIVVLKPNISDEEITKIEKSIQEFGYKAEKVKGEARTIIGAVGNQKEKQQHMNLLGQLPGVEAVVPIMQPNKLGSREFKNEDTIFKVGNTSVGGDKLTLIAGPCSVENEDQINEIAKAVKLGGASILRGGAFKPRTSPYTFQGLGEEGLKTELNITFSAETLIKLMVTIMMAILLAYMIQSVLKKAIKQ